jgi:hypothetical protein
MITLEKLLNQYPLFDNEPYVAARGDEHIMRYLDRLLRIGVISQTEYESLRNRKP